MGLFPDLLYDIKRKEINMEPSNLLVVCLGMGTVFVGLICLIAICMITSLIVRMFESPKSETSAREAVSNKQEIVAAVCAVIAEEIGTEAENIKVLSFKRI